VVLPNLLNYRAIFIIENVALKTGPLARRNQASGPVLSGTFYVYMNGRGPYSTTWRAARWRPMPYSIKEKGNFFPLLGMKAYRGSIGIAPLILNLSI
jgi:hypothetical protein